jgi:hypothetical protein
MEQGPKKHRTSGIFYSPSTSHRCIACKLNKAHVLLPMTEEMGEITMFHTETCASKSSMFEIERNPTIDGISWDRLRSSRPFPPATARTPHRSAHRLGNAAPIQKRK